jgi:DHA1 family L-arabinose/isopropyl-beta-D-thiogalactopyranoside export protein-like MFS transporter
VVAALVLGIVVVCVRDKSNAATHPNAARKLLQNRAFRSVLMTTVLVVLGQFAAYTYIVPYVVRVDGFASGAAAPLLLLFGFMGAFGNIGAGAIAHRSAVGASLFATASITIGMAILCCCGENRVLAAVALAVWGFGAGGLAVGLQTRVLALAPEAPDLASALFAGSFNVGIGGGALLGGFIVGAAGLVNIVPAGVGLALLAVIVQAVSLRSGFKQARLNSCAASN